METRSQATRPPIHMIDDEADLLTDLVSRASAHPPELAAMLLAEIERAELHDVSDIPSDVVTMNATIDFVDEANGEVRTVQLVYPREADFAAGRISILTPVGVGLIGLRQGQSILWPDRDGNQRNLTVTRVAQGRQAA